MKYSDQRNALKCSSAGGVIVGIFALLLVLIIPPVFMIPVGSRYYAGPSGALIGFLAAAISGWAFVTCPRRVFPKLLNFALLLPTLYLGFRYVSTFFAYGSRP